MLEVIFTYIPSYFVILIAVWWFWHGWNTWTTLRGKEQQGYREYVKEAHNKETPFDLLQKKAEKFENQLTEFIEENGEKNKWRNYFTPELFFTAFLLALAYSSSLFILNWFLGGSNQLFGIEIINNPFNIPIIWQKIVLVISLTVIVIADFNKSMQWYWRLAIFALAVSGVVALAGALAGALAFAFAVVDIVSGAVALAGAGAGAVVVVDTVAGTVVFAGVLLIIIFFSYIKKRTLFNALTSLYIFLALAVIYWELSHGRISSHDQIFILFVFLLPLVNAVSDWVSYAATRFIFDKSRKKLKELKASDKKKWWKIIIKYIGWDIGVAFVMFFVMSGLLFGLFWVLGEITPDSPFSVSGLWHLIVSENTLKEHLWIWVMVFSTLLPTAMHIVYGIMALFTGFIFYDKKRKKRLIGKLKEINSENEKGESLIPSLNARLYAFLHIELRRMFSKWVLIPISILAVGLLWQVVVGISFVIHNM